MSTLSACIRKAGKALSKDDADAIKALRDTFTADGMSAQEAAQAATRQHMDDLLAERGAMAERLGAAAAAMPAPTLANHAGPAAQEAAAETAPAPEGDPLAARAASVMDKVFNSQEQAIASQPAEVREDTLIYAANVTGVDEVLVKLESGPAEKAAFMEGLRDQPDAEAFLDRIENLSDTPWAAQAVMGILARQAMKDLIAGREPNYQNPLTRHKNALAQNLRLAGEEGLWQYLDNKDITVHKKTGKLASKKGRREGFIGHPTKPVNAVNASFADCDPTRGCATYCYATRGNYVYATSINKAEAIQLAVMLDPRRVGRAIAAEYKAMPESGKEVQKALRFFDKGDINALWLPVIEEFNKAGYRAQIFSKRPEILSRVNPINVRMLSIDESNIDKAEAWPDLDVALVYDGSEAMTDWALANAKRLAVILPIKIGQRLLTSPELARLRANHDTKVRLCPIDTGTFELGDWDCTRCDYNGGMGCFYRSVTAKVLKAATTGVKSATEITDLIGELTNASENLTAEDREHFLASLESLLSKVRAGHDDLGSSTDPSGPASVSAKSGRGNRSVQRAGKKPKAANEINESRVEARRGAYNASQSDLFAELEAASEVDPYENTDTRPDTNADQKALGRSALTDLFRQLTNRVRRSGGRGNKARPAISLLGARMYKNFVAGKPNQLVGQTISSPADLAALAQVYRDPRFETFRFVLTKKGKVVKEMAISSRLPALVTFGNRKMAEEVQAAMSAAGADGYWMMHNHPSGSPTPSPADENFTGYMSASAPGFQGHVIIDHNAYATLTGMPSEAKTHLVDFGAINFTATPEQPHPVLGTVIEGPETVARVAKGIESDPGQAVLIGTAGGMKASVTLVAGVPLSTLKEYQAQLHNPKTRARGLAALRRLMRASGSGGQSFLALPPGEKTLDYAWLVEQGVVRDVVGEYGGSLAHRSDVSYPGPAVERGAKSMNVSEPDGAYRWYRSELQETLGGLSKIADKAGMIQPTQAKLWLVSQQKKGAFKQEELEWSGLNEWLSLQSGKVPVQAIQDFVAAHGVQVEDVTLGNEEVDRYRAELEAMSQDELVAAHDDVFGDDLSEFDLSPGSEHRNHAIYNLIEERERNSDDADAQYSNYTVPGGKRYREVLLKLPANLQTKNIRPDEQAQAEHKAEWDDLVESINIARKDGHLGVEHEMNFRLDQLHDKMVKETVSRLPPSKRREPYYSNHWTGFTNVLAHVRMDDRTDADGKRVLFVHEIQSDWGQEGRKQGFKSDKARKEYDLYVSEMRERARTYYLDNDTDQFGDALTPEERETAIKLGERLAARRDENSIATVLGERDTLRAFWNDAEAESRVMTPTAPFVTDTKAWTALALKRVIAMAAEQGYDKVAIVSGEQAADMFSLRQRVNRIIVKKLGKEWEVSAWMAGNMTASIRRHTASSDAALAGIIGKELAERTIREGGGDFSGVDLEVGGAGMHGFYDGIVPQVARDVLKKLGGKPGTVVMGAEKKVSNEDILALERQGNFDEAERLTMVMERQELGRGSEAAGDAISTEQFGFDITPAMREQAARGLPLFKGQESGPMSASMSASAVKKAIAGLSKSWKYGPPMEVVQSASDLPAAVQQEMQRQGVDQVAGYFDRKNQRIYLVADGIKSARDAQVTLLHEAVGHFGLEAVMGRDGINQFLREVSVARDGDAVIQSAYDYVDRNYPDASPLVKAAEVVAYIAESHPKHSLVQRVLQMIRQLLRRAGFTVPFTNNDIIEALRRSEAGLRSGRYQHEGGGGGLFQSAYHGSQHRHRKFTTDKIGSGEGSQAYGWGLYFAQKRDVAEYYRDMQSRSTPVHYQNRPLSEAVPSERSQAHIRNIASFMQAGQSFSEAKADMLQDVEARLKSVRVYDPELEQEVAESLEFLKGLQESDITTGGTLYAVDVPENDELLDWDAPLSEQPPQVKAAIDRMLSTFNLNDRATLKFVSEIDASPETITGEWLYQRLSGGVFGKNDRAASLKLKEHGIPGLRYLDERSRTQAPDVPEFSAWAGYFKGVDIDTASASHIRELRAEYDEFVNAEDTRTRNFVIFDEDRIQITDTLFRVAEPVESTAFQKWFGDSKVVDEKGEPLVVYHHGTFGDGDNWTPSGPMHFGTLAAAEMRAMGKRTEHMVSSVDVYQGTDGDWHWDVDGVTSEEMGYGYPTKTAARDFGAEKAREFSEEDPDFDPADYGNTTAVYLSIQNPKRTADLGVQGRSWDAAIQQAKRAGYDGIVYKNAVEDKGRDSYIAFSPEQVKSADQNSGAFDPGNPSILFRRVAASPNSREAMNRRMREEHHTLWYRAKQATKRYLAPGGLLPRDVFNAKIERDSEMGATEMDVVYHVTALEHAFKKDYGKTFDRRTKAEERDMRDALAGSPPAGMPQDTATALEAMRQYIDAQSEKYIEVLRQDGLNLLNALPQDRRDDLLERIDAEDFEGLRRTEAQIVQKLQLLNTMMSNVGEYIHRSYRAFDDPLWPKNVPDPVLNSARDYFEARYLEENPGASAQDAADSAQRVIQSILKEGTAFDSLESYIRESKLGAKDLSILKRRKEIAPEVRALLGEHHDPRVNFAKTATKMSRLIFNDAFLKKVREIGMGVFLFEDGTEPEGFWKPISAEGNEALAPLDGLKTSPEINQAFVDALGKDNMEAWYRTIIQLNGAVKFGKTVLSPTTAARNFMSAAFFTMAQGHFDLRHAAMSLRVHMDKTGNNYTYLRKLKQLGVVYDTPYAEEMMRLLRDTDLTDRLMGGSMTFKHALDVAQAFYRFGDDFWKVIGFENEKALAIKHRGMTEEEAEQHAADRVRNTYPTYSMTGKAVNMLRRFPLAGTFVSFPAEIIRTTFNILQAAKEDMGHSKALGVRRLVGIALVSGLAYAAQEAAKRALGVDDEEEEAVREQLPPWSQNSNLYFLSRENGNLRYLDLSFLDPYNYWKRPITALLRDEPMEDKAVDAAWEMLEPFLGTDIAAGAIWEAINNKKASGGTVYNAADRPDEIAGAIGNHLRKALQPGAFSNLERIIQATEGQRTATGRQYNMEDEMAALAGFRVSTLDPKVSLKYRAFETADTLRNATSIMSREARDPNPVEEDELRDTFDRVRGIEMEAYQDLLHSIKAARKSGLDTAAIIRQLRAGGLSKRDAFALANGRMPSRAKTGQYLRSAVTAAGDTFGPDVQAQINQRRQQILQWSREPLAPQ